MNRWIAGAIVLGAAAVQILGWWSLWFLCDDAYISFRYVDQLHRGNGLVWNPAPFRPVEGYTSFLWVVLLDAVWRLTGADPPRSANAVSLVASLGSLGVVSALLWRWVGDEVRPGLRPLWLGLLLLLVVSNRTWLAWTSSGLETALWLVALLGWVAVGTSGAGLSRARAWGLCLLAGVLPLIRPDGLLFWALTVPLLGLRRRSGWDVGHLVALLPLGLPLLHVAWRWQTYGMLLPNTYYAKVATPWPELGSLYLLSFLWEYAYILWIPLLGAARLRGARPTGATVLVGAALLLHTTWYVIIAGGDHFEYRVLAHWVAVLVLCLPWAMRTLAWRDGKVLALGSVLLALALPIPWTHYAQTSAQRPLPGHTVAIGPAVPWLLRPPFTAWDALQARLHFHYAGLRHHTHRRFLQGQARKYPTRAEGLSHTPDLAVFKTNSVGYPAWVMPHIAILDGKGLNDAVVARLERDKPARRRRLAHERRAPDAYIRCFKPNVQVRGRSLRVRDRPIDAQTIRRCEADWGDRVGLRPL